MTDIDIADPRVEQYAVEHTSREPAWFATVAENTRARTTAPGMMVGTLEGRFLAAVVAMLRPARVLEIGTFTGYSALSMAEALPPGGHIVTCDISEEHVAIACEHIAASPYADRIEIRVGPAIETVQTLDGPFDLVFIDADKQSSADYLALALDKVRPGALIVVDNVIRRGALADPAEDEPRVLGSRRVVEAIAAEPRLLATGLQTVGAKSWDGMLLALVRQAPPNGA